MVKFCSNCGHELKANSKFCTGCGAEIADIKKGEVVATVDTTKTNGFALAGFIVSLCSLFIPILGVGGIVGVVLSSIGLNRTGKGKEKGKGFAIAGLVIGIIAILAGLGQIEDIVDIYNIFDYM